MKLAVATPLPLLELAHARAHLRRMSVDEYHQRVEQGLIPDRCELLEGLIYQNMPKSPLHEQLALDIFHFFDRGLAGQQYIVHKEGPLTLNDSEPEPDVSVASGASPKDFLDAHPTTARLIVEVAVDAPEMDRAKTGVYAAAGVAEYCIVLAKERAIEVYTGPVPEKRAYSELIGYGIQDTVPVLQNLKLPVASLFN